MAFGRSCRNWDGRLDRMFEAEEHSLFCPMPRHSDPLDRMPFSGMRYPDSERSLPHARHVRFHPDRSSLGGRNWTKVDKVNPSSEVFGKNVKASNKKDIAVKTKNENKPKGIAGKPKQAKEKKDGERKESEDEDPILDAKDLSFLNFCNTHVNLMVARLSRF